MDTFELIILALLIAVISILLYVFFFKKEEKKDQSEGFLLMQQQLQSITRTIDERIGEANRTMQEGVHRQFSESNRLIKEITQEVTSVKEIGRQTQSFAEQLQNLQDILKNPKQRGILGEYYLETVLRNVLPPGMYKMQYPFKNGEVVDAAVFVNKKIVPIDSKFSLENYNRFISAQGQERIEAEKAFVNDLKLRIQETAKYIRPEENTMDFAFMFIPSEGIYYDLLTNQVGANDEENLIQRSAGKYKVIIVSPTSFLAYLQTVLQGLKALEIEERALDIIKNVEKLGVHVGKYEEYYKKLGNSLATTVNHYNTGYKELGKMDKDVLRITGSGSDIEPLVLNKPEQGE